MSRLDDIIKEFPTLVKWEALSSLVNLEEDFIRKYIDYIDFSVLSCYLNLSEDFIRDFKDKVNWENVCEDLKLSEDFIRKFQDYVDWETVSCYQDLSDDFIREFQDEVVWDNIINNQKLSENFILEFFDTFNDEQLEDIVYSQVISDEIKLKIDSKLQELDNITKNKVSEYLEIPYIITLAANNPNIINWDYISEHMILPEYFMRDYKDHLNWDKICENHPKLSVMFIDEIYEILTYKQLDTLFNRYGAFMSGKMSQRVNERLIKLENKRIKEMNDQFYRSKEKCLK